MFALPDLCKAHGRQFARRNLGVQGQDSRNASRSFVQGVTGLKNGLDVAGMFKGSCTASARHSFNTKEENNRRTPNDAETKTLWPF